MTLTDLRTATQMLAKSNADFKKQFFNEAIEIVEGFHIPHPTCGESHASNNVVESILAVLKERLHD